MNRSITLQPSRNGFLIIYDRSQVMECAAISSLLDLLIPVTGSDLAHLYWMDPAAHELRLVSASSASEERRIPRLSVQFTMPAQRWMESLCPAGAVSAADALAACFPEMVALKAGALLVAPLRVAQESKTLLAGMLTISRKDARTFGAPEINLAGKCIDALIRMMQDLEQQREVEVLKAKLRAARQENALLEKRLAERKLVERAKGLLQAHHGWSEEDAYYHLRRTSRQERIPMAVIAQRVIDISSAAGVEHKEAIAC